MTPRRAGAQATRSAGNFSDHSPIYKETAIAILSAAALSFLGLGAQPPTPEWGAMLADGRDFMSDAWWIATFPGLAIMVTVMGFNFFGDALRDALDPKMAKGR
ncbi:MAG: binding-protein-dependent transport system inner rane component [candidate division NC10 bacterium]|nr:binding-protein-dependent transport system inner rane component [candidate division NC10 bacterium]